MLFKVESIPTAKYGSEWLIINSDEPSIKDKIFKLTEEASFKTDKLGSIIGNKTVTIDIITNMVLYPIHWMGVSTDTVKEVGAESFLDKYEVNDDGKVKAISLTGKYSDLSNMTIAQINDLVTEDSCPVQVEFLTDKEFKTYA